MASGKAGVHVIQLKPIVVQERLQQGCKFVKWDDDSPIGTHVILCIDSKGFFLYWKDSTNEIEYLEISSIRDTRTGRHARVPKEGRLRDSCNIGLPEVPLEEKTFTVVYGPDFVNTSFINFVAPNRDDAIEWTDSVLKMAYNLLALNSSPYTLLAKAHTKIQLMVDREGRVPVKNFIKQYAQHKDDKKRIEKALDSTNIPTETTGKSSSFDPDAFTLETFLQFYKHLVERNEVDEIFDRLTSGGDSNKKSDNHPRLMTVDQFVDFLNKEQRDPRLNEILYPYADRAKGIELIAQYEPNKVNVEKDCISADGFLRYLMSDDNAIVAPEKFDHNLDMDQPLNHYFVNSSHNTYLTGHQLTGKASVEIYRQCLLAGCRCIELDCWNGRNSSDEPIITHGYTVVSDIPCKDVLEAIAETAFKTSCYPVILSFENHCSTRQQAKIAQYCRKIFGEMLLTEPLPSHPLKSGVNLPSPNLLMRKILIKNKKKHSKQRKNKRSPNLTSMSTMSNVTSTSGDVLGGTGPSVRIDAASTMTSPSDTPSTVGASLSSSGLPSSTPERRATLQTNNSDESNTLEREDSSQLADNDDSLGGQGGSTSAGLAANNKTAVSSSCDMDDIESDSSLEDDDAGPPSEAGGTVPGSSTGEQLEGEMHKEEEACDDMSALVNYIQPVNFVSFEYSEKRNRSYEISSFVETQATGLLKERPVDFVNLNKVQLSRIYPKGTRVDSSNYMPQVFWNAGCQMVALNFQTLDLGMQLNLGIFEYNGRSGYVLKPDFMRRMDRKFDPFTESTVDGIIAGYVSVKVISGQFLSDKRTGTYVEVDMFGLPADTIRRKRTKTVPGNGVNPVYDDEPFIFKKVVLPDLACLRIAAYEEGGKFIGHRILSVVGLRPGYRHLALRNESGQPLTLPTLFVHITVKDYVPEGLFELADALANPIAYQSMFEKRAEQLLALTDEYGDDEHGNGEKETGQRSGLNNASTVAAKATISGDSSERKTNNTEDSRRTSSGVIGSSSSKHESMNGTVSATSSRIAPTPSSGTSSSQVTSSPAHPSTVPPLIRQDTTSLRQNQSVRSLSDESAPERSVYLLESEACNLEVEQLEALKNHKDVRSYVLEVNTKLEKDLAETKKKFEKSRAKVASNHQKEHKLMYSSQSKQRSVLVKNLFRKSSSSTDASLNKRLSEDVTSTSPETVEKLQELHRTWARALYELTLEQFTSEKTLRHKYHEKYYAILEGAMQTSQSNQEKYLKKLHDTDVNRVQKRVDAKIKEDYNNYVKKYKDKNELSRVRREQHLRIIDSAVAERQRLGNLLTRRKSELASKHELVQRDLSEDRRKAKEKIEREFQQKCDSLKIELESSNPTTFIENWTPK